MPARGMGGARCLLGPSLPSRKEVERMYDTSFDLGMAGLSAIDRGLLWFVRILAIVVAIRAASADAQLPGVPVLQNAWATPGLMIAVDAGGSDSRGVLAAAASWAPMSRIQLSGGGGYQFGHLVGSSAAYGVRVAVPLVAPSRAMGVAVFAGIGGASSHRNESIIATLDSVTSSTEIPVGVAVGWRHSGGFGRGFSLFATLAQVFYSGGTAPDNLFRLSLGGDIGLTDSWGITGGVDLGQSRPRAVGGPGGPQFGLGVSHAIATR